MQHFATVHFFPRAVDCAGACRIHEELLVLSKVGECSEPPALCSAWCSFGTLLLLLLRLLRLPLLLVVVRHMASFGGKSAGSPWVCIVLDLLRMLRFAAVASSLGTPWSPRIVGDAAWCSYVYWHAYT